LSDSPANPWSDISMSWSDVGQWLKGNAGTGAALVGSLLLGNVQGAVAAGVALVSSATGTSDPTEALNALQSDPATVLRLRELAIENEKSIRDHIENMTRLELESKQADLADKQEEHKETGRTIRNADVLTNGIQWVRPSHATVSLIAAIYYAFTTAPVFEILAALLVLPVGYSGLRQIGKFHQLKFGAEQQ
jgi:hypothetical protein